MRPTHQVVNTWSPFSRLRESTRARFVRAAKGVGVSHHALTLLRFEAEMALLRLRNLFSRSFRARIRTLRDQRDLRINIGAGNDVLPGWVNVDAFAPSLDTDVLLIDLRKPLPFADGSALAIYSEHCLEHFDRLRHGRPMLREFFRILRKGGVARVIVPDGGKFLAAYLDPNHPLRAMFPGRPWMDVVNTIARDSGHQFMYDAVTLIADFREAGFTDVREVDPGQGRGAVMDNEDPLRRATSLYIEAMK